MNTHRSVCQRVGVKLAPETDKEKAFSCETRGTVLGVIYDTNRWTWNLDSEKVKIMLHNLYDMMNSPLVTNEVAMRNLSPACQITTQARKIARLRLSCDSY